MLDVISQVQPRQQKVQDHEGVWSTLRITPYRTLDNRIDGVVVTLFGTESHEGGFSTKQTRRKSPEQDN